MSDRNPTLDTVLDSIQRESKTVLKGLLQPGEDVALLDYPLHLNAGDTLIYAGEREYLKQLGVGVEYVADLRRYSKTDLRDLHPDGPIVLHGGGNFGDRWPQFQMFRERVVKDFPDRRIIQLPQSIEFTNPASIERAHRAYAAHPDLILLLRDQRGLETAKELFSDLDVRYCPDLAFGYGLQRRSPARVDVLELRRTDNESQARGALLNAIEGATSCTKDWELTQIERIKWRILKAPSAALSRLPRHPTPEMYRKLIRPLYDSLADLVLAAAERTINIGNVVVTDRLHAAVLATLYGHSVVARDNANGKLSSIIGDYLGRFPDITFAQDAQVATTQTARVLNES